MTTGTDKYYIESFILSFSKDRRNWKLYKGVMSKERKVRVSLQLTGLFLFGGG